MIEEFFNEEHKKDYFAIRALYKISKDDHGNTNEKMIIDKPCTFIRKSSEGDEDELHTFDTGKKDIIEKFMFLPSMIKKQRQCVFVQGQSGSGKSYLLDDYVKLYKTMYPNNQCLYFTLNNAEIDTSLTKEYYKVMPMQQFLNSLIGINEDLDEIKKIAHLFANKMLIFDDVSNLKNNKQAQKTFWNFIDQSIENLRKWCVSVFIISHSSRTGHHGCILKEEMNKYVIVGCSMQTKNDRILTAYMGLSLKQISKILCPSERWVCIDTKKEVAIYPSKIKDLQNINEK